MNMKAPALVVLSACESGVFDIELADERRSLGTAFLEMGSTNVISTLWPVDDRASLLFMAYLYDVLRDTGAAKALAATQHWMRRTTDGEKKKWVRARMERSDPRSRARDGLRWLYRDLALRAEGERYYMQAYFWAGYQVQGLRAEWL
jgi:CHAT domain-containing protein